MINYNQGYNVTITTNSTTEQTALAEINRLGYAKLFNLFDCTAVFFIQNVDKINSLDLWDKACLLYCAKKLKHCKYYEADLYESKLVELVAFFNHEATPKGIKLIIDARILVLKIYPQFIHDLFTFKLKNIRKTINLVYISSTATSITFSINSTKYEYNFNNINHWSSLAIIKEVF